ncbi:hypothetical protein WKV53_13470 [Luteolibacter sp. Y139]|uniref:Uncharacterized protein n=1 Tax=Luteolibacter soli TaxID=3135280 RepID=A0ABU9AUU9_9BACT
MGDFVCAARLPEWKLVHGEQPFRPEDLDPAKPSWAFERVTAEFYGGYVKAWARCS